MRSKLFDMIGAHEPGKVLGRCLCGSVVVEIDYPAFWAWHDHSQASRLAHGAWRSLRHLCRHMAQAVPHRARQQPDHPLRRQGRRYDPRLLQALRHAALL